MKINIINTATDNLKTANYIAKYLVKEKLSPCIQIIPNIQSIYLWQHKLKKSGELLIIIKTIPNNVEQCKKTILKYHNYDIPEIIVTDAEILHNDYSHWFTENTQKI